ncbi:MAG: HD domain-containing protein [Patescibacteria group bacterium]|nr:HD domain-containing protein [Patescibacteria group bacterium]
MTAFLHYLDPSIPLDVRLAKAYDECHIAPDKRQKIGTFLALVRLKDEATYCHSVRVGIVASRIGRFMHLSAKALLYAGLLHDVGKALTLLTTLQKTEDWTPEDAAEMTRHATDSFRMLAGVFDFSAEIVHWHHRFQRNGYPETLPAPLHGYSEGTKAVIPILGRVVALADLYDALHRVNSKFGALTGEAIMQKMLEFNPDQRQLIEELYEVTIFTTEVFA